MLQLLVDGLVVGSTVALGAIGLTLTYSLLRFANFGHGELLTIGAYAARAVGGARAGVAAPPIGPFSFGWPLLAALPVAAAATALVALAVDAALFARLRARGAAIVLIIASFGAALALRNVLLFSFGPLPEYYSREIQIAIALVPRSVLGGMRVTPDQAFVLGLALACMGALHLFLSRTVLGKAMRATAMNPDLARVAGIDTAAVIRATWILGATLASVAGVFAGLTGQVRTTLGFELLLPMFAAAILGGVGSVHGAAIGGLVVGLAESLLTPVLGAEYRAASAFLAIIAILLVRPQGLFGKPAR
ncbi:MAG: branched-chain amino acid ABC transporter permease [Alphaproteobacteria bacterium]